MDIFKKIICVAFVCFIFFTFSFSMKFKKKIRRNSLTRTPKEYNLAKYIEQDSNKETVRKIKVQPVVKTKSPVVVNVKKRKCPKCLCCRPIIVLILLKCFY